MENFMEIGYHLSENEGKNPLYRGKHKEILMFWPVHGEE